jgi:hypothetical protein
LERTWLAGHLAALKNRGYNANTAASATVSAVGLSDALPRFISAMR